MEAVGSTTACGGPFFVLPDLSLLIQYSLINGNQKLSVYPLQECSLTYFDIRSTIKVSWKASIFEIEFFELKEYNSFTALLARARSTSTSSPPSPTTPSLPSSLLPFTTPSTPLLPPSLLSFTAPSSPSLTSSFSSLPPFTAPSPPGGSSSASSSPLVPLSLQDQKKISELETQVNQLKRLQDHNKFMIQQSTDENERLKSLLEQSEKEVETLTVSLLDSFNQPPPSSSPASLHPGISHDQVNKLIQTNTLLMDSNTSFKQQRERFNESISMFNLYAMSLEEQVEKSKNDYDLLIEELKSASSTQAGRLSPFEVILEEARAKYTQQLESRQIEHIDLAKAYYTVYYDLICKENSIRGTRSVSSTIMDETVFRLSALNNSQDEERINFLHQIQNVSNAKDVVHLAEQKIRADALKMQQNIQNLEIRTVYERLLTHIQATRSMVGSKQVKCFISYAWPVDTVQRENLQKKLKQIREDLHLAGIEAQLDLANMQGNIPDYMARGIQTADKVILICTPRLVERAAEANNNLVTELNLSIERQRTVPGLIVPVLLEGSARTSIPLIVGGQPCDAIKDLLFLDMTPEMKYEDAMVQLEPLGLIPMILGLGDNGMVARTTYGVAFDRYTLQKQQIINNNNTTRPQ